MYNKFHYDAKIVTMIAQGTSIATATDTGDKDICLKNVERPTILLEVTGASVDKTHTLTLYRCDSAGANDTAIPFSIATITAPASGNRYEGTYGTFESVAATGKVISSAESSDGTVKYLIEIDQDDLIDDDLNVYTYLTAKIATSGVEGGTLTASMYAILYGLYVKDEN
jgi:hypothetical protein